MSPTAVQRLRVLAAKASGAYTGLGQTYIAMRLSWKVHQDRIVFTAKQRLELWFRLYRSYPDDGLAPLRISMAVDR